MTDLFGVIGMFDTPAAVKDAAVRLRERGFRAFEAYTPYPVEGLDEIVHPGRRLFLPLLIFAGAILGAAGGYWIQYWDEAVNYPLIVGGRPYNSWPAFIVSTFEIMVLMAVTAGFFGLIAKSRLTRLYHPIFAASGFERASRDRFFICVEKRDPRFDAASIRDVLHELGAQDIQEIAGAPA
ncbi:MAG TPA: DUF3341 domain-containing protein [Xanthobacteraceae bacterium]|nr:DUF3341 domain-containing protein [Xanthobacteraceae bacterium]